jgi:hypothetical protein
MADQDFIDANCIFDDDEGDDYDPGDDCGRWEQNAKGGMLPYYWCRLAGTEFCDWECPFAHAHQ